MRIYPITPTRFFNSLIDCGEFYIKSSSDELKIKNEINYYTTLNQNLLPFHATFLGTTESGTYPCGYKISKIEEYDQGIYFIQKTEQEKFNCVELLDKLRIYFNMIPKKTITQKAFIQLVDKQIFLRDNVRIEMLQKKYAFKAINNAFATEGYKDIYNFKEILHTKIRQEVAKCSSQEVWASHGDLCLSNILIKDSKLCLIDPKGFQGDQNYFIPQYDFSKLMQCLSYGYDFINHGQYSKGREYDFSSTDICFKNFVSKYHFSVKLIQLITASHFLAMLPFHISKPKSTLEFAKKSIIALRDSDNE